MTSISSETQARKIELAHGGHLHCIEQGQGPAVVFLHGGLGDYSVWDPQLKALSSDHRCISVSRRYSWPNQNAWGPRDHTVHQEAQDIGDLLDALQLPRAHLVGSSYGAFAAFAFALVDPQRVASLALNEPPVHAWLNGWSEGREVYEEFMTHTWQPAAAAFEAGDVSRAVALQFDGISGPGGGGFHALPPQRQQVCLRNARSMEAIARSNEPFSDLPRDAAARLTLPILLVRGQNCSRIHRLVHEEMSRVMPAAIECIVPRASHGAPVENPDAFNAALRDFLRSARS